MCFPASKLCLLSLQMRRQLALFSDNLIFVGSWLLLTSYFSISVILPLLFLCLGNLKSNRLEKSYFLYTCTLGISSANTKSCLKKRKTLWCYICFKNCRGFSVHLLAFITIIMSLKKEILVPICEITFGII